MADQLEAPMTDMIWIAAAIGLGLAGFAFIRLLDAI